MQRSFGLKTSSTAKDPVSWQSRGSPRRGELNISSRCLMYSTSSIGQHFRAPKLAVILKLYTPPSVSDAREQNKRCYILALSDPETKSAPQGECCPTRSMSDLTVCPIVATSSQVLPPVWPFDPSRLAEGNDIYEFNHVPLSSIAAVTSKMIKVPSYPPFFRDRCSRSTGGRATHCP